MLVDANVLYPKTLRDWLALLYSQGGSDMFTVYWTDDIPPSLFCKTLQHNLLQVHLSRL